MPFVVTGSLIFGLGVGRWLWRFWQQNGIYKPFVGDNRTLNVLAEHYHAPVRLSSVLKAKPDSLELA